MSTTRINLYIAREVAVPTALGLVIFTFVLLMGRILKLMELVINKGVPLLDIGKLFAYLLPSFLVLTIPLAFLLGVLLGFGRLSGDSELVALKASGFSLYGMVKPVVFLALAVCALTACLTFFAGPAGNKAFKNQIFKIASSRANVGLQARAFNDEFDGLVFYANDSEERTGLYKGVFISDERVGNRPAVIVAEKGRVISDPTALTLTLRLEDGAIHRQAPEEGSYQIIKFSTYDVNLGFGELNTSKKKSQKPAEMTLAELESGYMDESLTVEKRQKYLAERHKRFIYPLSPLIFSLIGIPMGIQSHRSGRGGSFTLALLVFMTYYVLLSFAETIVVEAQAPALLTLWSPSLLFLAGGALLLYQTAREKRFAIFDIPAELARRLLKRRPRGSSQK